MTWCSRDLTAERSGSPTDQDGLYRHHRLLAVRAHLLEMTGDYRAARESYQQAARLTTSIPEQRYLYDRAARLAES